MTLDAGAGVQGGGLLQGVCTAWFWHLESTCPGSANADTEAQGGGDTAPMSVCPDQD